MQENKNGHQVRVPNQQRMKNHMAGVFFIFSQQLLKKTNQTTKKNQECGHRKHKPYAFAYKINGCRKLNRQTCIIRIKKIKIQRDLSE